jgi:FixJ family two-component response regulator
MKFTRRFPIDAASSRMQRPTIFIVDGDRQVRDALYEPLFAAGYHPRATASAEEFLARPRVIAPGCLIAELSLPGMSGLELQQLLLERTELPIIFMTDRTDVCATVRAMKAGACEFLPKPVSNEEVLSAVRHAISLSHRAIDRLIRFYSLQQRYASLSPREREVMGMVVCGRLNKQVGGELGISEFTVKAHRGSLMRKMRATSFAELVVMAQSLNPVAPTLA